ncbi:RND transporter, HAE1/HME family, permease protein [delta proteobacterium NaphS2]|nr:RND transporter, HAE1/HME family, permease protein [delta proteobacterium NaphS2]
MTESFIEKLLKRPYVTYACLALFMSLGVLGYLKSDRNLFPDSNYPEIAVVMVEPGASAKSLAANVAVPVEKELYTLDGIRRVYSSTIDEVSVIRAEFEYTRDLDMAAADVENAINKINGLLPHDLSAPQLHKISAATPPVLVIGISSQTLPLTDIRQLAENELKNDLLRLSGVANVDVFGGFQKELQIIMDKKRLDQYGLNLERVLAVLKANDRDYAIGFITSETDRYLLKSTGKEAAISRLEALRLTPDVTLGDVSRIYFGHYENTAAYYGNGKPAIALAVQRGRDADVIRTVARVEKALDHVRQKYPNLTFEITDSQKNLIVQSTENMFESLRDAIIMSTLVVFFFLASFRQVLVVLLTIPMVYGATIALMWMAGIEFNVVTLTGIILALGLLLDDAVVVMENIERHYRNKPGGIEPAVLSGTKEIMFADLSGTLTTMIALCPILFVGGYPQTIFRPLAATLLLALSASYVISITAVPLLSRKILAMNHPFILGAESFFRRITDRINHSIQRFFSNAVLLALRSKSVAALYFIILAGLFGLSLRMALPLVGQELLPPMDTGGIKVNLVVDPNLPMEDSRGLVRTADDILNKTGHLLLLSSAIGNEPGVLSIGSGGGMDRISITATYVDRYHREESVWDMARKLRPLLGGLENVKRCEVMDYGATALSSIRANIDVMLSGPDLKNLEIAGGRVEKALYETAGVVSVSRTWSADKTVYVLDVDPERSAFYGLTRADIARQLQTVLRGAKVASFPLQNSIDFGVRVWFEESNRDGRAVLLSSLLDSPKGKIPLEALAAIRTLKEPDMITREGLNYTLNVYGFREKAAISHIMARFEEAFKDISLPPSVTMAQTGDMAQFQASAKRMAFAVMFAVLLTLFTLVMLFNSVKVAVMVLASIPLTLIGASWALLLLNYHASMPAMMGFILLSGIIVNNAILLIHFAQEKMTGGLTARDAMLESIRIRTRPVLMTAFAVAAGMLPVALGSAIGLERLAPLGAVAIGGLLVGTFLTLLFIPLIFIVTSKEETQGEE